jgi:hypothetical protein
MDKNFTFQWEASNEGFSLLLLYYGIRKTFRYKDISSGLPVKKVTSNCLDLPEKGQIGRL